MIVTVVPDAATAAVRRCTQNVLATLVSRIWFTIVWFAGTVRATARSQSLPVAYTNEFVCVVVNDTVGAPVAALFDADAPGPDEFANATTVIA